MVLLEHVGGSACPGQSLLLCLKCRVNKYGMFCLHLIYFIAIGEGGAQRRGSLRAFCPGALGSNLRAPLFTII